MSNSNYYSKIKGELTDFGKNAVADVGRIMTLVQGLAIPENEVMKAVQDIYILHSALRNVTFLDFAGLVRRHFAFSMY